MSSHYSTYDIQPLYMKPYPICGQHIHLTWDITATMFMTSYELHVRSHPQFRTSQHFMYDIRSISLTSLLLYLCYHIHPIDDITATICMTSHPVYLWHHIHYIYDIISTKYDITTLSVDDANLAYVWHPLHCRWQRTHSITPNHSIYDVTST